jgi:hypothetical protein
MFATSWVSFEPATLAVLGGCNLLISFWISGFCQLVGPLLIQDSTYENSASHKNLVKSCVDVGMNCSTFIFSCCDLIQGIFFVNLDGSFGVTPCWFVPKGLVRTVLCLGRYDFARHWRLMGLIRDGRCGDNYQHKATLKLRMKEWFGEKP